MFKGYVYRIMIAGPSDTEQEVCSLKGEIYRWNNLNTDDGEIVLLPLHWKTNSYATSGKAQPNINQQICSKSDLLICVFKAKFGTPTDNYPNGSIEEIEEHLKNDKDVMVFICNDCLKNEEQTAKFYNFKEEYKNKVKWCEYKSGELADLFFNNLSLYINDHWRAYSEKNFADTFYRKNFTELNNKIVDISDELCKAIEFQGISMSIDFNAISEIYRIIYLTHGEIDKIDNIRYSFLIYKILSIASKSRLEAPVSECEDLINSIFDIVKISDRLKITNEQYYKLLIACNQVYENKRFSNWKDVHRIISNIIVNGK